MNKGGTMIEILDSLEDEQKQQSIMVPVGDMDVAEESPDTVDEYLDSLDFEDQE